MAEDVKVVAARKKQSDSDRAKNLLLTKTARETRVTIEVNGEPIELLYRAISRRELDALRAKHPPTTKQRTDNPSAGVNSDTFNPALVAACLVEPELTKAEVQELWDNGNWTQGELNHLYMGASDVCMEWFKTL